MLTTIRTKHWDPVIVAIALITVAGFTTFAKAGCPARRGPEPGSHALLMEVLEHVIDHGGFCHCIEIGSVVLG